MSEPKVGPEEFQAFPTTKTQQVESRQREREPYQSPHLAKPRMSAANMTVNTPIPSAAPVEPPNLANIQVVNPGFTNPVSDPEGISVELPSRFAFYGFKDLYVKTLKGLHLAKLSRAKEEQSTLHLVEAVSSVLSTSTGERNIGFQLTVPDFYFVLYWLRLNSFTKSVFIHESVCADEGHLESIATGELLPGTLRQGEIINKSSLTTVLLDEIPNPANYPLDYPDINLVQCTMQDAIEMTEDADFHLEEYRFAAQVAVYLSGSVAVDPQNAKMMALHPTGVRPLTLRERIKIVEDMSADDIQTVKAYETASGSYGTEEKIRVTCKACGVSKIDTIHLDAHSFFPSP